MLLLQQSPHFLPELIWLLRDSDISFKTFFTLAVFMVEIGTSSAIFRKTFSVCCRIFLGILFKLFQVFQELWKLDRVLGPIAHISDNDRVINSFFYSKDERVRDGELLGNGELRAETIL